MTAAAHYQGVSPERLRRFLVATDIAEVKSRRWVINDDRPRRVPVITDGRIERPILAGYSDARLAGAHFQAVGEFVRTNDFEWLRPFVSESVRSSSGRNIPLETNPNVLHRIYSQELPEFYEIYAIVSST